MRSFVVTIFIFIIMCTMILINNRYVKECSEYISNLVTNERFYEDPELYVEELEGFWDRNKPFLGLSIGFKELDRMSELITELKLYINLENSPEVAHLRILINDCAIDLRRLEEIKA